MRKQRMALILSCLSLGVTAQVQTADPKLAWAAKAVALQQKPKLDRLVGQHADFAIQETLPNWGAKLQSDVTPAPRASSGAADNSQLVVKQ